MPKNVRQWDGRSLIEPEIAREIIPPATLSRGKGVHHTTIITWVKRAGELLPDAYDPEVVSEVGELDELEMFLGSKNKNLALGQQ